MLDLEHNVIIGVDEIRNLRTPDGPIALIAVAYPLLNNKHADFEIPRKGAFNADGTVRREWLERTSGFLEAYPYFTYTIINGRGNSLCPGRSFVSGRARSIVTAKLIYDAALPFIEAGESPFVVIDGAPFSHNAESWMRKFLDGIMHARINFQFMSKADKQVISVKLADRVAHSLGARYVLGEAGPYESRRVYFDRAVKEAGRTLRYATPQAA